MKTISYFQIYKWDGGDRHTSTDICFYHEDDAKLFLDGNKYDIYRQRTLNLYESYQDYVHGSIERAKQQALAKLTYQEKQLLGLVT